MVLEAVRNDGLVLEYAPKNLHADRDVVMEVVRSNGKGLEFRVCNAALTGGT